MEILKGSDRVYKDATHQYKRQLSKNGVWKDVISVRMILEGQIHKSLDQKDNHQLLKEDEITLLGTAP